MQPELIEQIEARYKDEWLAIEVTETDRKGQALKGVLIAHGQDKDEVVEAALATKVRFLIVTYTGEVPLVLLEGHWHGNC